MGISHLHRLIEIQSIIIIITQKSLQLGAQITNSIRSNLIAIYHRDLIHLKDTMTCNNIINLDQKLPKWAIAPVIILIINQ